MGDENTPLTRSEARHLLRRTGFGADPGRVAKITDLRRGLVVDDILDFRPTKYRPGGNTIEKVHDSWIKYMVRVKDGIQEKLVLFWHDHFATSDQTVRDSDLMRNQNRTFRLYCKGNFKALVRAVNLDPAMMQFLDTVRNVADQPNENYARELQELFTLGVLDSSGNPTYTQEDIVQIARAFSGWDYNRTSLVPRFDEDQHDFMAAYPGRGPKVIYTTVGRFGSGGRAFDVPAEGPSEIETVLDIIFQHRDTTGHNTVARHIAHKLIAYFAHPNPSPAFVDAVIAASSFDTAFELQPLLRAIFVHDDFYLSAVAPGAGTKKSFKWPVDFVVSTLRQIKMRPKGRELYVAGGNYQRLRDLLADMGQVLCEPPSVFGWDWEEAWASSQTMLARYTFATNVTTARETGSTSFRPLKLINAALTDPAAIVDAVTDVVGVKDDLSLKARQALIDYLGPGPIQWTDGDANGYDTRNQKIHGLFALVMQSPAYQLH